MNLSRHVLEASPLLLSFGSAFLSSFSVMKKSWHTMVLVILAFIGLFFAYLFFSPFLIDASSMQPSFFEIGLDKFSLFVGIIFCLSLFVGIFPVRYEITISPIFLYYIAGGIGIILSNNLLTFFIFWLFQRTIPFLSFMKDTLHQASSGGGTYIIQHVITSLCFVALLILAYQQGYLYVPFSEINAEFFSWPVLILSFIIIYQSHGIFPFHSWVHDMVGHMPWYEISSIFLARAGVLLFVKFLFPSFYHDPDIFKIVLLALSIFSSIYWSFRGIFEQNISKTTTYFYVAQSSLILTGLLADTTAAKGSYLHMMVISLSGTSLWSIMSYIQHVFSIKRSNQFYGLAQYYPKLATLFCMFGFCMIGVPLGPSHVVEDLIVTGLLGKQPYLGLGHIFATCLNGILFFLVFSKLFLGQPSYRQQVKVMDMPLLKMAPYVMILFMMLMIGIMPHLFLENLNW